MKQTSGAKGGPKGGAKKGGLPQRYSPCDLFTGALQHTDPALSWSETDKRCKKWKLAEPKWGGCCG